MFARVDVRLAPCGSAATDFAFARPQKYGGTVLRGFKRSCVVLLEEGEETQFHQACASRLPHSWRRPLTARCAVQGRYHSVRFVHDSVRRRALQVLDDYLLKLAPPPSYARENKSGLLYVQRSRCGRCAERHGVRRRLNYSPEEDAAIMRYVQASGKSPQGNKLWLEMERNKASLGAAAVMLLA